MEKFTLIILAIFVPFVVALCYMMPAAIALKRHHPRKDAIRSFNLFFGWTVIGWLAAFVWSLSAEDKTESAPPGFVRPAEPHITIASRAMNEIKSEVVGLDRRNDDGTERRLLVASLLPGQELRLERVPEAVNVCLMDGRQIGVLLPDIAARIAMNLDGNRQVDCHVLNVIDGGDHGFRVEIMLAIHLLRSPDPTRHRPSRGPISAAGSA